MFELNRSLNLVKKFIRINLNQFRQIHLYDRPKLNFTELSNRKVLKVSGKDAFSYIQMMTTNNLQKSFNCSSSFMTNPNSKILCDFLIYKIKGDVFDKELILNGLTKHTYGKRLVDCLDGNEKIRRSNKELIEELKYYTNKEDDEEILYLECDAELVENIRKTFFVRNLGNDVKFEILNDQKVYTIYPSIDENLENNKYRLKDEFISTYFICVNDPRLPYLGQRVISKMSRKHLDYFLNSYVFLSCHLTQKSLKDYKLNRYKLGVGEGLKEHFMGSTVLSSFNADLLYGVNLYKGGFLGSTPINRLMNRNTKYMRRLLPFEFINPTNKKLTNFPCGTQFVRNNNEDQVIGEYINSIDNYGIGYFKLNSFVHIAKNRSLKVQLELEDQYLDAIVRIPFWWPYFKDRNYLTYEEDLMNFKDNLLNERLENSNKDQNELIQENDQLKIR